MQTERAQADVGCLLIDDMKPGTASLSGLCASLEAAGIVAQEFSLTPCADLYERLQSAYYEARSRCASAAIVARGEGCWAALALAEQLPADRMVLIGVGRPLARVPARGLPRPLARLRGFALRNLSFVTADILALEDPSEEVRAALGRLRGVRGRVTILQMDGGTGEIEPFEAHRAVSVFLMTGELPKSLAENSEMCIIYG